MMKKIVILLGIGLLFSNCTNTQVKEYEGVYTFGHEVRIFKDKNTKTDYWLYSNDKKIQELNNYMESLREKEKNSYSEVNIRIEGIDEGKATNGFAEPNDKKMKVINYEIIEK